MTADELLARMTYRELRERQLLDAMQMRPLDRVEAHLRLIAFRTGKIGMTKWPTETLDDLRLDELVELYSPDELDAARAALEEAQREAREIDELIRRGG